MEYANEKRLTELSKKITSGEFTTEEMKELQTLAKEKKELYAERGTALNALIAEIQRLGATPLELFEAKALKDAINPKATKKGAATGDGTAKAKNIVVGGVEVLWGGRTKAPEIETLKANFKSGAMIKEHFINSDDLAAVARLVCRLEREVSKKATKAQLEELGITRAELDVADEAYQKTLVK